MAFAIDSTSSQAPFKIYLMTKSAYEHLAQGHDIDGHTLDENAFYLTTDTHRLYIGNIEYTNDNNIIEVLS